jgi:hypothetical protein
MKRPAKRGAIVEGPAPKARKAPSGSRPARERAAAPRALAGGNSGKVAGHPRAAPKRSRAKVAAAAKPARQRGKVAAAADPAPRQRGKVAGAVMTSASVPTPAAKK